MTYCVASGDVSGEEGGGLQPPWEERTHSACGTGV